jgi:hypothetical protein
LEKFAVTKLTKKGLENINPIIFAIHYDPFNLINYPEIETIELNHIYSIFGNWYLLANTTKVEFPQKFKS